MDMIDLLVIAGIAIFFVAISFVCWAIIRVGASCGSEDARRDTRENAEFDQLFQDTMRCIMDETKEVSHDQK